VVAERILSADVLPSGTLSISSTLSNSVVRLYSSLWDWMDNNLLHPNQTLAEYIYRPVFNSTDLIYAPLVQVQCGAVGYDTAPQELHFTVANITNFTTSGSSLYSSDATWIVPDEIWNVTRLDTTANFTWIDMGSSGETGWRPSGGALVTVPYNPNMFVDGADSVQSRLLIPCMIDARWAAADVRFDPTSGPLGVRLLWR